ncbi:MAG TPA: DUF6624 domain-containing protein [Thermoanaerobaculia bacterium]|nr:DUF6624 domain-containing protein [Thermoanaerobaculia bacterium]
MPEPVPRPIRDELLALIREDYRVRETLARDGTLFDGYHPDMRAVHDGNAGRLDEIVTRHGWPGRAIAGEDGAEAAFLIAVHAIAQPPLQRRWLEILGAAVATGDAPLRHLAHLEDRVRTLEGRPQRYGTQFDWDADGEMSPLPIEDPDRVDRLRAEAGLMPLADAVRRQREAATSGPERPPDDWYARALRLEQWRREVGWTEEPGESVS